MWLPANSKGNWYSVNLNHNDFGPQIDPFKDKIYCI